MTNETGAEVYRLHVWIRQITPMIWRRLLVCSDSTIADLHYTLQIAFGWSDEHMNLFHIHGQDYGVYHDGGINFSSNAAQVRLCDFKFRNNERFFYEYDFGNGWQHEVRVEARLTQNQGRHSSSSLAQLLTTHSAPELLYLETKFASLMSYGLSVELLTEVLPIADEINHTSVRRQLHRVAERIEGELGEEQSQFIEGCPNDWAKQPPPGPPLMVGLDGGYVHASDQKSRTEGWFEVIAGKSVQTEGGAKVFAFVNKYDTKPKRRLYEVLKSQGLQMNQQVVFLSDGGDTVRDLQTYLSPESEHLLDWFHVTMRLTVMGQMVKGMMAELKPGDKCPETTSVLAEMEKHLESVKWNLWHGNVLHALQRVDDLDDDLAMLDENPANKPKLLKAVREFRSYIEANQAFIPNYGDRFRHGETISSAFVESTVNYVISKRFVKKQQMRWTRRGAHLLLQTRVQVLNDDLRKTFCRWFPGMKTEEQALLKMVA